MPAGGSIDSRRLADDEFSKQPRKTRAAVESLHRARRLLDEQDLMAADRDGPEPDEALPSMEN